MITKIFGAIAAVCTVLVLLLTSVELNATDEAYYHRFQEQHKLAADNDMSEEELGVVTSDLINYLKVGDAALLRPHFGVRAVQHMDDVYELFRSGRVIRSVSLLLVIVIFGWGMFTKRISSCLSGFAIALRAVWLAIFAVVILVVSNFSSSFVTFHNIFFDNDLWILDPNEELMIRILPQEFFSGMSLRIVTVFVIALALVHAGTEVFLLIQKRGDIS